ncbi:MAG: rhodanese-like domain-containing protein [Verrucomicrobiota bacterium]
MKILLSIFLLSFTAIAEPLNPHIDAEGFQKLVTASMNERKSDLLTENQFVMLSKNPDVVVLDARTKEKFDNIHVKGAVHLAFTDFTAEALAKVIPEKTTTILIYCNNNFGGDPVNLACKVATVSLNLQTYANLRAYGYTNIKELKPYLDVRTTKIPMEGLTADSSKNPNPILTPAR